MSLKKAFAGVRCGGRNGGGRLAFEDLFTDDESSSCPGSAGMSRSYRERAATFVVTPPRTAAQRAFHAAIEGPAPVVVACGPAGTGKTLAACEFACRFLDEGRFARIVMVRPAVAVQEDLGYLPGTLSSKLDPFMRPIYDVLEAAYDKKQVKAMLESGVIEACAIGFCRGRTFRNSIVIADEMQNATPEQMKMLLTRLGPGSKMVITGDPMQHDRAYGRGPNGFSDFLDRWQRLLDHDGASASASEKGEAEGPKKQEASVEIVRFGRSDIQRSPVLERVLRAYEDFA